MFGNTSPCSKGRGLRGQFMKNICDGNSMECESHGFYSPTSTGSWIQFTKNHFAKRFMKWPEFQGKLMFGSHHPLTKGIGWYPKKFILIDIAWNVSTAWSSHFSIPHIITGGDWGSNAKHNVISSSKMLVNCPQSFPIWRLPNISFLCRSWHFNWFLAKTFLWKLTPVLTTPCGWGLVNMTSVCRSWIFHAVLSKKTLFSMMGWCCWTWIFCTDLIFCLFPRKNIYRGIDPPPHHYLSEEWGQAKVKFFMHIWTFHALSIKIIFSEIATNTLTYGG